MTENSFNYKRRIGRAAEHKVIAELILRGFNVYTDDLDNGIDLMLENGLRIQVKASSLQNDLVKGNNGKRYIFHTRKRYYKNAKTADSRKADLNKNVDFVIAWGIEDNLYFIIPVEALPDSIISIYPPKENKIKSGRPSKYMKYLNAWDLLK